MFGIDYGVAGLPSNGGPGFVPSGGRNSLFLWMVQKGRVDHISAFRFLSIDSYCAPVPLFSDNRPERWFGE
jgi:hypothetical protein